VKTTYAGALCRGRTAGARYWEWECGFGQSRRRRIPSHLLCVVEDDSQREPRAAVHTADAMAHINAVVASRAFHRPIARRENNCLPAIRRYHLRLGLRPGLLLDQDKLSAFPIAALLPQQKNHLQGKAHLAVEILMQAVETAGLVVQHQRSRFCLPRLVADIQESRMLLRISPRILTEHLRPAIGHFGETRISPGSELRDYFRKRVGEILVIANAKSIALHDHVTSKMVRIAVESRERFAFLNRQNRFCNRIASLRKRLVRLLPVYPVDSFSDGTRSGSLSRYLHHAASQNPRDSPRSRA